MESVAAALAAARAAGVDRLDAQLIVGAALGQSRSWLLAHGDAAVDAAQSAQITAWLARRADAEPLAYLLGEREFHGLAFAVDARVLVPRPETEVLVDWALDVLRALPALRPQVVDLGTGSAAIAVALGHRHPAADLTAVDLDAGALAVAAGNASRHGVTLQLQQGSWWQPLAGRRFDLAVANPPYIAAADTHLPALRHEPLGALVSGADGLDALREIVAGAAAHRAPDGGLLLVHGATQAEAAQALLSSHGFAAVSTRRDLAGLPRCSGGRTR